MTKSLWQSKNVIVTGASKGLGWHLSAALYRQGASVVMVARDPHALAEAVSQIVALPGGGQAGGALQAVAADVLTAEGIAQIQAAGSGLDGIDMLINAVGKSDRGLLLDLTSEELTNLWKVNVLGTFSLTSALLPQLKKSSGVVVNIGSLASKLAPRFLGGYAVAKFSLAGLSQQLRLELAESGVHVLLVCPGPIRRADNQDRYQDLSARRNVAPSASAPGGGAKVKGLDPAQLSQQILKAAAQRQSELVVPWKSRILLVAAALSPRLGDWMLRRFTS